MIIEEITGETGEEYDDDNDSNAGSEGSEGEGEGEGGEGEGEGEGETEGETEGCDDFTVPKKGNFHSKSEILHLICLLLAFRIVSVSCGVEAAIKIVLQALCDGDAACLADYKIELLLLAGGFLAFYNDFDPEPHHNEKNLPRDIRKIFRMHDYIAQNAPGSKHARHRHKDGDNEIVLEDAPSSLFIYTTEIVFTMGSIGKVAFEFASSLAAKFDLVAPRRWQSVGRDEKTFAYRVLSGVLDLIKTRRNEVKQKLATLFGDVDGAKVGKVTGTVKLSYNPEFYVSLRWLIAFCNGDASVAAGIYNHALPSRLLSAVYKGKLDAFKSRFGEEEAFRLLQLGSNQLSARIGVVDDALYDLKSTLPYIPMCFTLPNMLAPSLDTPASDCVENARFVMSWLSGQGCNNDDIVIVFGTGTTVSRISCETFRDVDFPNFLGLIRSKLAERLSGRNADAKMQEAVRLAPASKILKSRLLPLVGYKDDDDNVALSPGILFVLQNLTPQVAMAKLCATHGIASRLHNTTFVESTRAYVELGIPLEVCIGPFITHLDTEGAYDGVKELIRMFHIDDVCGILRAVKSNIANPLALSSFVPRLEDFCSDSINSEDFAFVLKTNVWGHFKKGDAFFNALGDFFKRVPLAKRYAVNILRNDSLLPDIVADVAVVSQSVKELIDVVEKASPQKKDDILNRLFVVNSLFTDPSLAKRVVTATMERFAPEISSGKLDFEIVSKSIEALASRDTEKVLDGIEFLHSLNKIDDENADVEAAFTAVSSAHKGLDSLLSEEWRKVVQDDLFPLLPKRVVIITTPKGGGRMIPITHGRGYFVGLLISDSSSLHLHIDQLVTDLRASTEEKRVDVLKRMVQRKRSALIAELVTRHPTIPTRGREEKKRKAPSDVKRRASPAPAPASRKRRATPASGSASSSAAASASGSASASSSVSSASASGSASGSVSSSVV